MPTPPAPAGSTDAAMPPRRFPQRAYTQTVPHATTTATVSAADWLERASVLAQECELFIEAFDLRWRALRSHISATVASSKALAVPAPGLHIAQTAVTRAASQARPTRHPGA